MMVIDADKFLGYLIFSKHIDSLKCEEVKEAVEMCKVDVLDKIRAEIRSNSFYETTTLIRVIREADVLQIIDKYKAQTE